jgi:predicted PurR-regulated permease PerM
MWHICTSIEHSVSQNRRLVKIVGLLFSGWVWNVRGLLLAVPMLVVIKAVCDHVEDFKGVGELLGD